MDRRSFVRRIGSVALFVLAGGTSVLMTGCGIFSQISAWIPTAILAINGIVTVLGALVPAPAMAIVTLIDAALNSLKGAIDQYNADTNPSDKATLLAKIRTILTDIASNFQGFLNALNIGSNPIIAIVIGLANIILSAIAGFLNALPTSGTTVMATSFTFGGRTMPVVPKYYKHVQDFMSDYNQVCEINHHPEIELH